MLTKFIVFAALLLALAGCADPAPGATPLFAAPMVDRDGQVVSIAPGAPLIVNFWARWCPPCRDEMPDFQALHRRHAGAGLRVIGIAIGERPAEVRVFAEQQGYDYPLLIADADGQALMRALGNESGALPYTLAIDREGRIVARKLGRISARELASIAQMLLPP